jgi:peptidoglycan hydrolase CwlO-like protein
MRHQNLEKPMQLFEAKLGKLEAQLKQWGAKLDDLVAKAEETGAEVKVDYRKHIDELKSQHKAAQVKFDELKTAGSEKWETLKTGVESAWNELETTFQKLAI